MSSRDDGRHAFHSPARAIALAILVASSSAPAEPTAADGARPPAAPSAPATAGSTFAPDSAGPYAPAVRAPAGATVLPKTLMREQADFRLQQGLRNVPGVGASGR